METICWSMLVSIVLSTGRKLEVKRFVMKKSLWNVIRFNLVLCVAKYFCLICSSKVLYS